MLAIWKGEYCVLLLHFVSTSMVYISVMFTSESLTYLHAISTAVYEGSQLKYRFCIVASDMTNLSLKSRKVYL